MSLKTRIAKLESKRNVGAPWPDIQLFSWDDGKGPFAAFIPGQRQSLSRISGETEEAFRARAQAHYADIKAKCEAAGVRPNPEDPLQDLLNDIAKGGRTILNSRGSEGTENDE